MDISFQNKRLRTLCESEVEAVQKLGKPGARKLKARLADIEAASCVTDLVAGNPHPLSGDRSGQFALALDGGRRLVFEAAHDPVPRREDGSIDWSCITKVRIAYVGDYHGHD